MSEEELTEVLNKIMDIKMQEAELRCATKSINFNAASSLVWKNIYQLRDEANDLATFVIQQCGEEVEK